MSHRKLESTRPATTETSAQTISVLLIGVGVALYPLCRWYAGVKQRSRNPWLSYV